MDHRIAFLHSYLPAGGSTIFLINLGGELVRRGVPVHVFCSNEANPLASDFERERIPVTLTKSSKLIFEDRIKHVLHGFARFQPTTVILNIDFQAAEVAQCLPSGLVRIGVVHSLRQIEFAATYPNAWDALVAVSKRARDLTRERPELKHVPIDCLELGVPIPQAINREHLASGAPLRILYLGRLENLAKRVRIFPQILERFRTAQIPFTWTIAGEGPELSFLQSAMRPGSETQRVVFRGRIDYAAVPALLEEHDVILLVSDSEAFPLSLQEGMAAGLVPVVSDLPGRIQEIVSPDVGILVAPSNIAGYAEGIIWLHQHRAELQAMSAKARSVIGAEHSVAAMADRWLAMVVRQKPQAVSWPASWKVPRPQLGQGDWRFSSSARVLRRLARRVKALHAFRR